MHMSSCWIVDTLHTALQGVENHNAFLHNHVLESSPSMTCWHKHSILYHPTSKLTIELHWGIVALCSEYQDSIEYHGPSMLPSQERTWSNNQQHHPSSRRSSANPRLVLNIKMPAGNFCRHDMALRNQWHLLELIYSIHSWWKKTQTTTWDV